MRVSVVINTYNRGKGLRVTLHALRYQTYDDFEVVVVNGPSTDDTARVLDDYADAVREYRCPEVHLSKSRNIGVEAAAGEIVAFIDDDAVPEPTWLAELVAAYDSPKIGGAGGIVYDHTGTQYQYEYSVCNRVARPRFDITPPFDDFNCPGADPFLYLQGTNCSFRRDALIEIGGFDEEIEYYLDEAEVCMRIIDRGYHLRPLAGAPVHHKYLASHIRNQHKVVLDPFSTVKNHCCFAVRNGTLTRPLSEVLSDVANYVEAVKLGGKGNHHLGRMTDAQLDHYLRRVEFAMEVGTRKGLTEPRKLRHISPPRRDKFRQYPTLRAEGGRMRVCFVSREYPPQDVGGVGRFSADLADGFAAAGHEVHVITHSHMNTHTVDYEAGVWMHRMPAISPKSSALQSLTLGYNLLHCATVYHEIDRIHRGGGVDVVAAPIWLVEGAIAALDQRWPTILELQTTMKTIVATGGAPETDHSRAMVDLEAAAGKRAAFVHAISASIGEKYRDEIGGHGAKEFVVHLGTRDLAHEHPRRRGDDGKVRILFVGRLEPRKGVDVLLDAVGRVFAEFPDAELVLAGKDNTPAGSPPYAAPPEFASRVAFVGEVSEQQLLQHYADCDFLVLPSRFESFGLVLTEAMMFGKPVIAARAGGMVEIVAEGENGFLFAPGDAADLADQLRKLLASADTRKRFGEASRRRYERRFSTDVMVRNTIQCHRDVIASHHRKTVAVADALAELIREVGGASKAVVDAAVKELLTPKRGHEYIDYADEVRMVWDLPPVEFLGKVFHLFLGRPLDAVGLRHFSDDLANGVPREAVVRGIATSEEARLRKIETAWLDEFAAPPSPPVPVPAPPRISIKLKMKGAVKKVPGVGKGLRLLKQLAKLPRTVRDLANQVRHMSAVLAELNARASTCELEAAVRRLAEAQRDLSIQLGQINDSASGRDRRTQWHLAAQAAKVEQLLAEVNRLRGVA